jgi:hypothetical protein
VPACPPLALHELGTSSGAGCGSRFTRGSSLARGRLFTVSSSELSRPDSGAILALRPETSSQIPMLILKTPYYLLSFIHSFNYQMNSFMRRS